MLARISRCNQYKPFRHENREAVSKPSPCFILAKTYLREANFKHEIFQHIRSQDSRRALHAPPSGAARRRQKTGITAATYHLGTSPDRESTYFRLLETELEAEGYQVIPFNVENYKDATLKNFLSEAEGRTYQEADTGLGKSDLIIPVNFCLFPF